MFGIDNAPPHVRKNAVDMLLADESTRKVSTYLEKHGIVVSHSAVARYKKLVLQPAVAAGTKLQQIERITNAEGEKISSVADLTKRVLEADPLLARLAEKRDRSDKMMDSAVEDKDYKGFAAIDRADTANMTLEAQLTGRLQQQGPSISVQLVFGQQMPETPVINIGDVIDIEGVPIK
jgi:hypothetical protein